MLIRTILTAFIVSVLAAASSQAATIRMEFVANAFSPASPTAPTDPVLGLLTWEASSTSAPIDQLLSIDLEFAGHHVVLAETGFLNEVTQSIVGGAFNGVATVDGAGGTHDFFIFWDRGFLVPLGFAYASDTCCTAWSTSSFLSFTISQVPEPETYAMFLAGLGLIGLVARRRRGTQ